MTIDLDTAQIPCAVGGPLRPARSGLDRGLPPSIGSAPRGLRLIAGTARVLFVRRPTALGAPAVPSKSSILCWRKPPEGLTSPATMRRTLVHSHLAGVRAG